MGIRGSQDILHQTPGNHPKEQVRPSQGTGSTHHKVATTVRGIGRRLDLKAVLSIALGSSATPAEARKDEAQVTVQLATGFTVHRAG